MRDGPNLCKHCKFWNDGHTDHNVGTCHRHAPTSQITLSRPNHSNWPETYEWDWCGDFEEIGMGAKS